MTVVFNEGSRNGYRARDWDTRAETMEVAIPKLRSGSYFPDWLLERRRRAERALTTVVATGVNADGHREILGLAVTSAEDGAGWLSFFPDLVARGPVRGGHGHLRRPRRAGRGDRCHPCRARRGNAVEPITPRI